VSKERMATTTEKLASFRARLQTEAETLVLEVFPQKILDLDKMIFDEKYSFSRLPEILPSGDLNTPVPEPVKFRSRNKNASHFLTRRERSATEKKIRTRWL
ncbi:hypothetical protein PMAYCL1PPCAC_12803, partial [Pristionchus mayeri]